MTDKRGQDMAHRPPYMAADDVTDRFLNYRELLFSVVYNMLGTVTDTEDVLQEVWLAWAARHRDPRTAPIENARAYLVRAAANQAVARRVQLSCRKETYIGPWLPEPLVTEEDNAAASVERKESLSTAVLIMLESLSPLERAVFVLHDVFGFEHSEIAEMLDRSTAAVRQLASRARRGLHARHTRHRAEPHVHARVTERFVEAMMGGDLDSLFEVLAPDVALWTDSGGVGPAMNLRPVQGRDAVAAAFVAIAADRPPGDLDIRYRWVAGDPCALVFSGDTPLGVVVFDLSPDGDQIRGIYSTTNPEKMSGIR
jgi:RNA polymerase sigma factor (sigma-70 family)